MKEVVSTSKAPAAIGPYSQAIKSNGFLFLSGQCPFDPATGAIVGTNAVEQATQVLNNMQAILEDQGLGFGDVVKVTCFIKNMGDFGKINEVYAKYFQKDCPARSCVEVARLPKDVQVEIEAIAVLK